MKKKDTRGRFSIVPAIERFERLCVPEPNTGCTIWLGETKSSGYGRFYPSKRKFEPAHVWAYKHYKKWRRKWNRHPTRRLVLDHKCRNRWCVNPDHLEPVTNKINTMRGAGPTAINAKKTHCKRGHEFEGANLIRTKDGKRNCRTCRRQRKFTDG